LPGLITSYDIEQSSQLYFDESEYDFTFYPVNPISADGMITVTLSDQVKLYPDSECLVETYQVFDGDLVCDIDAENRLVTITDVFATQLDGYNDKIHIRLSKIQNPKTN
jgi:hypothetical protein